MVGGYGKQALIKCLAEVARFVLIQQLVGILDDHKALMGVLTDRFRDMLKIPYICRWKGLNGVDLTGFPLTGGKPPITPLHKLGG